MYKGEARVEAMRTIKEALALTWGRYHHNLDQDQKRQGEVKDLRNIERITITCQTNASTENKKKSPLKHNKKISLQPQRDPKVMKT